MSTRTLNTLMGSHSPTANGLTVHGGNRRDRTAYRIVPAELAAWTAEVASARADYATHLCPFCGESQVGMSLNVAEMHRRACQRKAGRK